MILFIGLVLIESFSSASAACNITNGTVAEGQVLIDTGCYQTICLDGEIVKKKACPEGFTLIKFGGNYRTSCVKLIKRRMDWNSAWAACAQLNVGEGDIGKAKLVEAPNKDEYEKVLSFSRRIVDDSFDSDSATPAPEQQTTSSYLLRELNDEEEESVLNRWEMSRQMRDSTAPTSPCGVEFTCENGNECVEGKACDNHTRCSDSSDTYYCGGPVEFWMSGNNERNPSVMSWVTSSLKVKNAPVPERSGLCLAVAFEEKSIFDCDFEGLYPMCEVCSSNSKVDNGCEYNDKFHRDGEEVDRQECGRLICRKGEIEEDFDCSPGYTHVEWNGGNACYKFYNGNYTHQQAKDMCKAPQGIKKLAVISSDKEGETLAKFLDSKGAYDMKVWVGEEKMPDSCMTLKSGEMAEETDCDIKAAVLCESCYSESEQEEGKDAFEGCTYMSVDFSEGDQIEPDQESCTATVCQGKGEWEVEYFGRGCCEVNTTIVKPGPTENSKLVADENGADCREEKCEDGEFTEGPIVCGCKGENGDIYPHLHSISQDLETCEEKWCNNGTIATKDIAPPTCKRCRAEDGTTVPNNHIYSTDWGACKQVYCNSGRVDIRYIDIDKCKCKHKGKYITQGTRRCILTRWHRYRKYWTCSFASCNYKRQTYYIRNRTGKGCPWSCR